MSSPKTPIAVPIAFLLVALAFAAPALAVPMVEVTVDTDKSVYAFGENVHITCRVYNPTDELALLGPPPLWWEEMRIYENAANRDRLYLLANQEPVSYRAMFITMPNPVEAGLRVSPGQTRQEDLGWRLSVGGGCPGPGEYELVPVMYPVEGTLVDYINDSAHIVVIPEPGMLALALGAGALVFRRKGRGCRAI